MIETNWYVITGSPSCGKTTVMNAIAWRGFAMRPEAARMWIDEEMSRGKTLAQIRQDEVGFQSIILRLKQDAEGVADPSQLIVWDRGMPDSIAYLRQVGGDPAPAFAASRVRRYKTVFLLDRLSEYRADYCRSENETEAVAMHHALHDAYAAVGYEVVSVPAGPVPERVQLILSHISRT